MENKIKVQVNEEEIINKEYYSEIKSEDTFNITCPICFGIIIEPYFCFKCQNSFCKECIMKWKNIHRGACIFRCRNAEFGPKRIMKSLLKKLKFKCQNGCQIEINYINLEEHYTKTCSKIPKNEKGENMWEKKIEELTLKVNELSTENNRLKADNEN